MLVSRKRWRQACSALCTLLWLTACSSGEPTTHRDYPRSSSSSSSNSSSSSSSSSSSGSSSSGSAATAGRQLFDDLCLECHAPKALVFSRFATPDALMRAIAETMPPYDPSVCGELCAAAVAAYIGEPMPIATGLQPLPIAGAASIRGWHLSDCWSVELVQVNAFATSGEGSLAHVWRASVLVDWPLPEPGAGPLRWQVALKPPSQGTAQLVAYANGIPFDAIVFAWTQDARQHTWQLPLTSRVSHLELRLRQPLEAMAPAANPPNLALAGLEWDTPNQSLLPAADCADEWAPSCAFEALGGTVRCLPASDE